MKKRCRGASLCMLHSRGFGEPRERSGAHKRKRKHERVTILKLQKMREILLAAVGTNSEGQVASGQGVRSGDCGDGWNEEHRGGETLVSNGVAENAAIRLRGAQMSL